ncbi:MAG: acyl-[ACP]--phospholipid O-acyltransferase [Verrucomicrobiota bacterium]
MKTSQNQSLPRTFWWHNITAFCGAMNDNLFKLLMVYALITWHGETVSGTILASVGLVFALPYLLIVPIAGSFADKFSKRKIIVGLKAAEIGIMGFGVLALALHSSVLLYITMFLMSSQSAFFGPCKYGLIPEQVGTERLSRANGSIQLFTFLAIIMGTILAPELSNLLNGKYALAASASLLIAAIGFACSLQIETSPSYPHRKISFNGFGNLKQSFRQIKNDSYLSLSILALTSFSLIGAYIQLNVLNFGFEHLGLSHEHATRLFLVTAIGIGIGSTVAGWLSGRSIEFGIVPIGAGIMCGSLLTLGLLPEGSIALASLSMLSLGFAAGLFVVPLESFLQYRCPEDRRGSIQAANAFFNWIGILAASVLIYLNSSVLGWTAQQGFLILAIGLFGLTLFSLWILPDFLVKFILLIITRFCYRINVRGIRNLPADQPALLVSNHVSLMDALLISACQQRRIRMLMSRNFYKEASWLTKKICDLAGVIKIHTEDNPKKLIHSLRDARKALDEGYLVCVFAEGALTRTGMMRPFKSGFERIVKGTNYPIIPVYIGGIWGSIASYRYGMPKMRPLRDLRYPVSIHFGQALPTQSTTFEVQQAVSELSVDTFEVRKENRKSLPHEFILSARRNWNKLAIVESNGRKLKFSETLTAAILLRNSLRSHTQNEEQHIGILLPNSAGSCLSNLAISLSRQISVNLNYTAPSDVIRSAQEQCKIRTLITSRQFIERFPNLPLPENTLYIEDLFQQASKLSGLMAYLKARFLPAGLLSQANRFQADDTATILFSSGSTDEPKGVILSHHNLLSNIESFRSVLGPKREDVMLGILPHFHSFGYTATFWFPLISGLSIANHPNPLEAESIGRLAEKSKASILLTTPSFLLAYTRKIKPKQFEHLRHVFTGAEKLPSRIADMFEKRFGRRPLEGYGATELSPVCALSLPNVEIDSLEETGHRQQRLGRVLPGMAIRIVHPETFEKLGPGKEGMICIKGPNVMQGYLNKPELTNSAIRDGWYITGDIGLIDTDGFFAITGRLSRFSKIGGEMISHGAIEKALQSALQVTPEALAVVAKTDDRKGEKLVVIHTCEVSIVGLAEHLKSLNIPNLWKPSPRDWICVERLPLLGSGKLDYRTMKDLAGSHEAGSVAS